MPPATRDRYRPTTANNGDLLKIVILIDFFTIRLICLPESLLVVVLSTSDLHSTIKLKTTTNNYFSKLQRTNI